MIINIIIIMITIILIIVMIRLREPSLETRIRNLAR